MLHVEGAPIRDEKAPAGPLEDRWERRRFTARLVSPANRRKLAVIVVGTGLAGASAAATLGELGYRVKSFCYQDSPRRAHSIAARGGSNAAKNYRNDGDSVHRLFHDTVKGGDFRSRESNVYRLAQLSLNIIDQAVAQGVPFAREYGGLLDTRSFGGAQVSRTFYARGQTGQQLLLGAEGHPSRHAAAGPARKRRPRTQDGAGPRRGRVRRLLPHRRMRRGLPQRHRPGRHRPAQPGLPAGAAGTVKDGLNRLPQPITMHNALPVYAEPPGFDRKLLAATLRRGWGIAAGEPTYVPVGFGTHHFRAGRWWVNVDHTGSPAKLDKALRAVVALAAAGLEFAHAPRPLSNGGCVAAMPGGYAVSVFETIDGQSHEYGEFPDSRLRLRVLRALGRLHACRPAVRPEPDSLQIPHRDTVFDALDRPWTGGPFGEPARELIGRARQHVQGLLDRYDDLVPAVLAGRKGWVVTHGEPHAGNVMATGDGIKLIDWDTVRLGPPERDLWMINPQGEQERAAYGTSDVDQQAMDLYRRWWALSEICAYAACLRAPHAEDADTRIAWRELQTYLNR